jgi:predicted permease
MWSRIVSWLVGVTRRRRVEQDMREEMAFHLEARTAHWRAQGLAASEASRRARLEFGAVDRYQEEARQARGLRWVDELRADLRYGLRSLRGSPVFTAVAVAILAIAIGASTAVFSVVEAVRFRYLGVRQPEALRELAWIEPRQSTWRIRYDGSGRPDGNGGRIATSFAHPIYTGIRDRSTSFSHLMLFTDADVTVNMGGGARQASALLVSSAFLTGLGTTPAIGRDLDADDDRPGVGPVAVIGYGAWQREFGGDPQVLGRAIRVNGASVPIVGVLPRTFEAIQPGQPIDLLLPVAAAFGLVDDKPARLADAHFWGFRVMGRLRDGIAEERARLETEVLMRQVLPADLAAQPPRVILKPGGQGLDSLRRNYASSLNLLAAIVAAVLLIACANIAGLMLTRASSRMREIDLRLALGAGRGRVVRQLLTESVLLATIGAAVGVGLALLLRESVLPALNQDDEPIQLALGYGPAILALPVGLALAVGLACGVLPAFSATRRRARLVLTRALGGGTPASPRAFGGKTLVAVQIAVSVVLLVGAALFTRTFVNLRTQAFGFRPEQLVLVRLDATTAGYQDARLLDYYDEVRDRVAAVPGVQSVAFSRYGLLSGGATRDSVIVVGAADRKPQSVHIHYVSPRYFETMGIPLVVGRAIASHDVREAPRVVVVNQALARAIAGGTSAVGQRLLIDDPTAPLEVVGVVGDAHFASVRAGAPPTLYRPYRQNSQHQMTFAVRVAGDPTAVIPSIRRAVAGVDPDVPVSAVRTQEAQIDEAMRQERMFAYVASSVGLLALTLACLGIYGTLAYGVTRRSAEIGVRIALGASRRGVVSMCLRESLVPVVCGAVAGTGAALLTTRYLESRLFDVAPRDAVTLVAAVAAIVAAALAASWLPARRAARIDPVTALRQD